jgi:uncharacterized protein YjbI with pentapeptide repeats
MFKNLKIGSKILIAFTFITTVTGGVSGYISFSIARTSMRQVSFNKLTAVREMKANLVDANLVDANLAGANLIDANIEGVNLSRTKLEGAKLGGASYSNATIWPEGFNPEEAGADFADVFE